MSQSICNHCGENTGLSESVVTDSIAWCKSCINTDIKLLHQAQAWIPDGYGPATWSMSRTGGLVKAIPKRYGVTMAIYTDTDYIKCINMISGFSPSVTRIDTSWSIHINGYAAFMIPDPTPKQIPMLAFEESYRNSLDTWRNKIRKDMANRIVALMPNRQSYVFGGYIRDTIAGDAFKDIDIYLHGAAAKDEFIGNIQREGYTINHLRDGKYPWVAGVNQHIYSVSKNGVSFELDLLHDVTGSKLPVPSGTWDSDVNKLYMRNDGVINTGFDNKYTLGEITALIKKKEYSELPGMNDARRKFFANKGYIKLGTVRPDLTQKKADVKMDTKAVPVTVMVEGNDKKNSFMEMIKQDANKAAYRVAATQMTTGTKAALLTLLERQGHSSDRIKAISDMLDTEIGAGLISLLLGMGLTYVPMLASDPRAAKMATEFRVHGMATAGNAVLGAAMESFIPVLMNALAQLPQEDSQLRVAASSHVEATNPAPTSAAELPVEVPTKQAVAKTL